MLHPRTQLGCLRSRPRLLFPLLAEHQGLGGPDYVLAECLDLDTAPLFFVGFYYQLLIRQEVIEEKYALSSSDPDENNINQLFVEDRGDIWSYDMVIFYIGPFKGLV